MPFEREEENVVVEDEVCFTCNLNLTRNFFFQQTLIIMEQDLRYNESQFSE